MLEQIKQLGGLLSDLGLDVSVIDRKHRVVWCTAGLEPFLTGPGAASQCFAAFWKRPSRCPDCLPTLVFATGEPHEGVRERHAPGAPRRAYKVRAVPLRDAAGTVEYVAEILIDVTGVGVQIGLGPLAGAQAAPGHGHYAADARLRIVSWSPSLEAILGWRTEEVLGRAVTAIVPTDRADEEEDLRRAVAALAPGDAPVRRETVRLHRDGRRVPVALAATAIRDDAGEVIGHHAVLDDRSEVQDLRRRLRDQEERLAAIVRSSADAIFAFDADGRITSWNAGAEQALGRDAAGVLGRPIGELLASPTDADTIRARVRTGGVVAAHRALWRRPGGETIELEATFTGLRGADGEVAGASVVARDVRERRRLEQQMVRSEKLAAVGSLAAGLAHEIGTPLQVISASAEYLLLELPAGDPRREEASGILAESERIGRLVSDLLGFARGRPREGGPTRAREAVDRVARLVRAQFDKQAIELALEVAEDLPAVAAPPDELQQVLLNLLLNAGAFAGQGGHVRLAVLGDSLGGTVAVRPAVRFRIADSGPGVPPEMRERIFDPFVTTRSDGTGLGLFVCSRIVSDLGGEIQVGSVSPGGGGLFEVLLPAAEVQ